MRLRTADASRWSCEENYHRLRKYQLLNENIRFQQAQQLQLKSKQHRKYQNQKLMAYILREKKSSKWQSNSISVGSYCSVPMTFKRLFMLYEGNLKKFAEEFELDKCEGAQHILNRNQFKEFDFLELLWNCAEKEKK